MEMRVRAQSLDKALPAVAGFLTDRTGIPVIRGETARTDGKAIYLPRRRNEIDLTERDLVESVAFLYHEGAHLLYSDFGVDYCEGKMKPLFRFLYGLLEDMRIERQMMAAFPSARRYLTRLVGILAEEPDNPLGFVELRGDEPEQFILQSYMLRRLRHEVLQQAPLAQLAERATEVAQARLPAGMLTRLNALMFQVVNCQSGRDVFDLASAIITMMEEEEEEEKETERREQNQQAQQDFGSQPEGSQGESPQQALGQGGEGEPQQGSPDSSAKGDLPQQPASGAGPTGEEASQALSRILNMSDEDVEDGIGEKLKNAINASAQQQVHSDRDDTNVAMPNVHRAKLAQSDTHMSEMRGSINAIRTATLQWMGSIAESEVSYSHSGMHIDPSRIWQGRLGGAIFRREEEGIDLNAAISIVIDRSSSMHGRIVDAVRAAAAGMLAFDVPGIKTQVVVFPWYGNQNDEGVAVIKHWEEGPRQLASRIASLTAYGSTPMAEALLFAASSVSRREETLKMVIVVTDGQPDNAEAARHIIGRARADGINVAGLGINEDTSLVFGSRYAATVTGVEHLSGAMVKLVKAAFEDKRRMQ